MEKIGMIGLGVMGHGIAQNIINNGFKMALFDLKKEAMEDLVKQGAEGCSSAEELGTKVDTVFMIVNSYKHCLSVFDSLLKTMNHGTIINMSTITTDDAKSLAEIAKAHGVSMMDCPVSGGTAGAKAGTLTIMAGGSDELFEKYKPGFEAFGKKVVHVGKNIGDGQAIKAINQLLVGVHMCATAEAFTIAKKAGLDLQLVYDTICASAGR